MSMHGEKELSDNSTLATNEVISKSDGVPKHKQKDPIDFLIVTCIPHTTHKFQWIIRQFSSLSNNNALYSTCIYSSTIPYYLKLVKYEHGFGLFHVSQVQENMARRENCFIFGEALRHDSEENDFSCNFEHEVSANDSNGKELMKWSVSFSDNKGSQIYEIGTYMNNTLGKLPNDSLILDCSLKALMIPTTEKMPIASKPSLECNGWKNLSRDFKTLYENSSDTDITLVVGTEEILAHKLILTARSPVFKKTFCQDMKEVEQKSVVITDVEFPALQRLVDFLYTGVILDGRNKDMDLLELYDLYYVADKYEVMDLREMAGNALMERIQVDNASEILVWADRHADMKLKYRIMNFIRINFEVVTGTDSWAPFSLHHPELGMEIVNFCLKKSSKEV